MKKLLLTPLLAILSGCVSYYYPYGEPVEGVRYVPAEEYVESVYYEDEVVDDYDYSDIYVSSPYYPWWSIDYFYLGSRRHHSGFSIGINYGSPWSWGGYNSYYDPFYPSWGYSPWSYHYSPFRYSAWYSPYYDRPYRHFGGHHYFWRNRYHRHHGYRHHDRDRHADNRRGRHGDNGSTMLPGRNDRLRDEDFAGNNRDRNDRRRRGEDGPGGDGRNPRRGGPGTDGMQRHTSVAAGTAAGQRGMEIRNRQERKPQPSRMEPVNPDVRKPVVKLSPADGVKVVPPGRTGLVNSRGTKGDVRSRAGGKNSGSKVTPIKARPYNYGNGKSLPVSKGISSSRRGATTVRSPSDRKPQPTRLQPTKPAVSSASQSTPVVTYRPRKESRRGGQVVNSRKPIANISSKPSRPAPVTRTQPRNPVANAQRAPSIRSQAGPATRPAPARQQKAPPKYSAPAQRQSRPAPPPAARSAARPSKPKPSSRPAAGSENKGGSRRASGRKER